jgi:hypothetical protein
VKDQSEIQAMHRDLPKHKAQLVQFQRPTEMMDRKCALDLDMLSMYGQDDLRLSVFVVEQMLAVMEFANHFLPVVSECQ